MSIIIPDGKEHRIKTAFELDKEATDERAARIAASEQEESIISPDRALAAPHQHNYVSDADSKRKNFDQKKYLFPESFNALRRELEANWPILFNEINPDTGTALCYDMVFNAPQFIGTLNGALDLTVQFDTGNIDNICKTFLNALRVKRGLSRLDL